MQKLNIQLLLTGNELMIGDIIDSNSAMIAQKLLSLGLIIKRKVTIADDIELLINEIKSISKQADILIINGGLGPTVDDLTAQALADSCHLPLEEHPKAVEHLNKWSTLRGRVLDHTNLKQAILPESSNIIANKLGSAVGFHVNFQQCDIYCTPGVPNELEVMMEEEIIPLIQTNVTTTDNYQVLRFHTFGIGESDLQKLIRDKFQQWPQEIELGFRASSNFLELKLTIKNSKYKKVLQHYEKEISYLLGNHILSKLLNPPPTMAKYVIDLLIKSQKKITVAESCTGGLIASMLTSISGSSTVFEAGYVTYSNKMKHQMIDVSAKALDKFGAVSKEVVLEMAQGALLKSAANYTIAVSGIAGPNGGTETKPVGSVWIAWGTSSNIKTVYLCIRGSRNQFQIAVANRALDLIRRDLLQSDEVTFYLSNNLSKR